MFPEGKVMTDNNSQFEEYLKQFRPLPPESLRVPHLPASRVRFRWTWAFAVISAVIAVMIVAHFRSRRVEHPVASQEGPHYSQPLTIGRANAKIFAAPSIREALDEIAFPPRPQLSKGEQSTLEILGREKTKL